MSHHTVIARVVHLLKEDPDGLSVGTRCCDSLEFRVGEGIVGSKYAGVTRGVDVRERAVRDFFGREETPPPVLNIRHVTIVGEEEVREVARRLDLPHIPPGALHENMVLRGLSRLTTFPFGTMLFFESSVGEKRRVVLLLTGENYPCEKPARTIEQRLNLDNGSITTFSRAAKGRRGATAMVYASGEVRVGDKVVAYLPA